MKIYKAHAMMLSSSFVMYLLYVSFWKCFYCILDQIDIILSIHCSRYGTRYNRPDKRFLEVPRYHSSVHTSKNHFGHSFAIDTPTVWNDLPDDVCSAPVSEKKLKSYLFDKAFSPSPFINYLEFLWYRPGYVYGMIITQ